MSGMINNTINNKRTVMYLMKQYMEILKLKTSIQIIKIVINLLLRCV